MRALLLALVLALPAAGCTDALGIVGNHCQAEMATVRAQYGQPGDVEEATSSQLWFYPATQERQRFTFLFDWSGGSCDVSGPNSFSIAPSAPLTLP